MLRHKRLCYCGDLETVDLQHIDSKSFPIQHGTLTKCWCGKQNDRPYVTLAMPFNLILSIYPVFLMAMPVSMILVMYVIQCILSYDFNKLTMLYIHVHISISMTNKSGLTFFLSIKYLSVCLSVGLMLANVADVGLTLKQHWAYFSLD